ncbi:radical SAM protein [Chitinispirillales bacterium ANBcel5]|uniref:SPL family radical SAM protein n=1 Tax=Cellulosispirillum alkaliphilum TaxID=3039283 RepID=UPI002A4F4037|nr:radical SAM protein [Chitinispirillales bacterium ANBcel5]
MNSKRQKLVSDRNKGEFWKPCPGTTGGYLCCGYQIITPLTGCGMYCNYCILQVYLEHQHQTVYENFNDLENELKTKLKQNNSVLRFGTGEFADSLYLENTLGVSKKVAALLEPYKNVLIEFKTKSTNIDTLGEIKTPRKVVIGFSLNTQSMVSKLEEGTASIEERLRAARKCEEMGFNLAFHFDPMIWYDGWEKEYREVVRMLFSHIKNPQKIAWCSMGGFRSMPALKHHLKKSGKHLSLFAAEMITGIDGKLRYPRPCRVSFYRAMKDEFEKHYPDITLYMCMESPEVWRSSGMIDRIPRGLKMYLDERASGILGI